MFAVDLARLHRKQDSPVLVTEQEDWPVERTTYLNHRQIQTKNNQKSSDQSSPKGTNAVAGMRPLMLATTGESHSLTRRRSWTQVQAPPQRTIGSCYLFRRSHTPPLVTMMGNTPDLEVKNLAETPDASEANEGQGRHEPPRYALPQQNEAQ